VAYASLEDLRSILPENVTIGNITSINVTSARRSTISTEVAVRNLSFATQYVDSRLSALYLTPLTRVVEARSPIIANMLPSSTDVMVDDIVKFRIGACVRLKDTNGDEISQIKDVPEQFDGECNINHLTLIAPTRNAYDPGSEAIVEMMIYPDPISSITARVAVGIMFDKLFTTDGSPDVSNYGKTMRNLARDDIDSILIGVTRLKGQQFIGKRFARQQLFDTFKAPGDTQPGQGRE
jgi:hypothetical protein